ncbi:MULTISPECIES: hypothetical protein [unclassified Romboutsia]|uniref:hypothetical protein n=1 Tax=unclassified Romboutsia TaxID=2626894 RepID=UPI000820E89C|nr:MULTISPECIES: hypothetical protein [unclassified Romboutsia]SCG97969.1 Uncharacterised protein [uncultured Clostridium sp.]
MEKIYRLKQYGLKALKETVIIVLVSLILLYLGLKLDNSIILDLLINFKNIVLIAGIVLFVIWYFIILGVNYIYGEMDIRSKKNKK